MGVTISYVALILIWVLHDFVCCFHRSFKMENTNTHICHNCEMLLLSSGIYEMLLGEIRLAHGAKVDALIMTAAVIEELI